LKNVLTAGRKEKITGHRQGYCTKYTKRCKKITLKKPPLKPIKAVFYLKTAFYPSEELIF